MLWIWIFFFYLIISLPPKPAFHTSLMLVGLFSELEQVFQILCSNPDFGLPCAFEKCKHSWEKLALAFFSVCSTQTACFLFFQTHLCFLCEVFFHVNSWCPGKWPKTLIDPLHPEYIFSCCLIRAQRVLLTNKRLALTSEIMENLHSVKAYGWEEIMETIIKNIRQ